MILLELHTSKSVMFNGDKTIHCDVIGYFEMISDEKGNNFSGFIIKITGALSKHVLIFPRSISTYENERHKKNGLLSPSIA